MWHINNGEVLGIKRNEVLMLQIGGTREHAKWKRAVMKDCVWSHYIEFIGTEQATIETDCGMLAEDRKIAT